MSTNFYFTRIRSVKPPTRGTEESAGLDFFVPDDFVTTVIRPGSAIMIPSGIKCAYPPGYALILFNKSGISSKYKLTALANVCDSDYQGEIHISLINVGTDLVEVSAGMKIAQFILMPIELATPIEIESEQELWDKWSYAGERSVSQRGDGGFGSTGEF
jgi:dUTP pyrophosphatase